MPNNFKLTGTYYVSKAGDNANAGTSANAPKRSILNAVAAAHAAGSSRSVIVGSGQYLESNVVALNYFQPSINITGDGAVVVDGQNSLSLLLTNSSGGTGTWTNLTFRNYANITIGPAAPLITFVNCTFVNCNITLVNQTFSNCRFINCVLTLSNTSFNKTIFVNTTISGTPLAASLVTNCFFKNSFITTSNTITAANFNWNVFQDTGITMLQASAVTSGVIQDTLSKYYDLSIAAFTGSGTPENPYGRSNTNASRFAFAEHRIAYPTYNASSSAADPKFNSIEDQDFTVQAGSPLLAKASDGTNVGGVTYAMRRSSRISFSGSSATVDPSLIFQYDNYIISGSQVTGSITSAPIAVNTRAPKVIQKVTYNGLLAFNKDTGSASGSNQNVPDFDTFTSASLNAAANPDRLVYYMRHTTGSSIPVSDPGWDNGGLWTAGEYNVFEWNTKPSIDNVGVGNGSGSFNAAASPTFIQATYVQMKVKLRNDYLL